MGLGIALGRRRPGLVHAALPALAVLAAILAFAEPLHLMRVRFPDPSIFLWAAETQGSTLWHFLGVTVLIAAIFWAVAAIFALVAAPLGPLFDQLPPLRAYTADIAGSLAGIVAITLISATGATPWQWMALGALPILWFSRSPLSLLSALAVIALAGYSGLGAFFSPYNRIDIAAQAVRVPNVDPLRREWDLRVNRDYHQRISDFSGRRLASDSVTNPAFRPAFPQAVYELPFRLRRNGTSALIVGAGTGNDAAAGLRAGYASITAVEIDPTILQLGRLLHPENPYGDARVRTINDDARAYFERERDARFDVVTYGLLDSHAMFSAMSSLRLDNYVYTLEGIRAGWRHVGNDGVLSVAFSTFAGPWIEHRLLRTIREATGHTPMLVRHQLDFGASFIVGRSIDSSLVPAILKPHVTLHPVIDETVRIPTDDWPFLYIRPGTVPYGYLTVLFIIAVTATVAVRRTYRRDHAAIGVGERFDWTMFLMGAGFMLLETRMVTELSLLFGSTWIVNACVFGGVLLMILLANFWVARRRPVSVEAWFIPLLVSIVATWAVGAGTLNQLDIALRGLVGGVMFALPIGCAGVIVATLLARSSAPAGALGANLLGAVLGGILEYSSMFLGLTFVAILALVCYVAAYLTLRGARVRLPLGPVVKEVFVEP
jgi:SAM-dependent methyltransferase